MKKVIGVLAIAGILAVALATVFAGQAGEKKAKPAAKKTLACTAPGCSLTLTGSEKEVVDAAVQHSVSAHGQKDTPEFREQVRSGLKDAKGKGATVAGSNKKTLSCTAPGCSLTVSGTEKEVEDTVVQHSVSAHGQQDTPQFRQQIRSALTKK